MVQAVFSAHGALFAPQDDQLVGLTDLRVVDDGANASLVAVTYGGGYLTSFDIGTDPGQTRHSGDRAIDDAFLQLETTDLVLHNVGGQTALYMAGLNSDDLRGFTLDLSQPGAPFRGTIEVGANGYDLGSFTNMALFDGSSFGLATLRSGGLVNVSLQDSGQLSVSALAQGDIVQDLRGTDIVTTTHNGQNFAFVSYEADDRIGMFRTENGTLTHVADAHADTGLWVDRPNALTVTEAADGALYVIAAASGSQSLSVLKVAEDANSLRPVDQLTDSLDTRFANASHVTSVVIDDRNFIVAAGNDQGISLLTVLPGGRLQHIDALPGTADTPLHGITALEAMATPDGIRIWASTQSAPYLAEFSVALPNLGNTSVAADMGGRLSGSAGDDILMGGDAADLLSGGAGADILVDGAGTDRLTGNSGSDVFILLQDDTRDVITDFELGRDKIDLSDYSQLDAIGTLSIQSRSWGAELRIGNDVLEVRTADGSRLQVSDFTPLNLIKGNRSETDPTLYPATEETPAPDPNPVPGPDIQPDPDPLAEMPDAEALGLAPPTAPTFIAEPDVSLTWQSGDRRGDASSEVFVGYGRDDRIFADGGDDSINAGAGADAASGGAGNDSVNGADGSDFLYGGAGDDTLWGGNGEDTLSGGSGHDTVHAGNDRDVLMGGGGNDHLDGENDHDQIWGGDGADRLYGGAGNDWISAGANSGFSIDGVWGEAGNDTLFGNDNADLLNGGTGDDVLDGGAGQDQLYGKDGDDVLFGGDGFDRLYGGDDDDQLSGGAGGDGLFGQAGHDTLWGDEGDDRFFGGTGDDVLDGGEGDDTLSGDDGRDTLYGAAGDDHLEGGADADTFVFASDHGDDVIVDFDLIDAYEVLNLEHIAALNDMDDVQAASEQVGDDTLIRTGADSSILLKNVDRRDLSEDDFAF